MIKCIENQSVREKNFLRIMLLLLSLILVVLVDNNCASEKQIKNYSNLSSLSKLHRRDDLEFCDIGCVLNDRKNRPNIDDPGRNLYDRFSVISTSYVSQVVGSYNGLIGHPLRVMVSDLTLSKSVRTSVEMQRLRMYNGESLQRITFNLRTEFEVVRSAERSDAFLVRIPHVVPHVVLLYDYTLELGERRVTGVVSVEASDYPRALEVEVVRDDDKRCRVTPLDEEVFKDYLISIKVRGENRHVIGTVSAIIQEELIENGFPFEVYMNEINEFTRRFLKEAIIRETKVIKENTSLNHLCDIIGEPLGPDSSSVEDSSSSGDDSCEDDCCECESCACEKEPCGCRRTVKIKITDKHG